MVILESSYFPQKTLVKHGDIVRFVNESGQAHTVFHAQGNWETPQIAEGEELLVTITSGMTGEYSGMTTQKITGQLLLVRPDANN